MRRKIVTTGLAVMLTSGIAGCGSKVPRPSSDLALAESALKSAEQSGAREHAPIELRTARQKQAAADKAMADEHFLKARYLTVEARVDAELAAAAAEAQKSKIALGEAQDTIELMRDEVTRTGYPQ